MSADPQELLALSRGVRWDFPSSAGKPLHDSADAAEECFKQIPHSDDAYSEAMSRLNEATVAFLRGDLDRARALLESAGTFFAESPMAAVAIDDRFELDWLRDQLR